jgi:hypothetical protein
MMMTDHELGINLKNVLVLHQVAEDLSEALHKELTVLNNSFCGRVVNFANESFNGRTVSEV